MHSIQVHRHRSATGLAYDVINKSTSAYRIIYLYSATPFNIMAILILLPGTPIILMICQESTGDGRKLLNWLCMRD